MQCSHNMYVRYHKVFSCTDTSYSSLFKGRFVWDISFPPSGGPGRAELTLYAYNNSGPSVMNCTFQQCSSSYGDNGQEIDCAETQCCTQGWADGFILVFANMAFGASKITMQANGTGQMSQTCMPVPLQFTCQAFGCEFPGQDIPPLTVGTKAVLGISAGFVAILAIVGITYAFFAARRLKQRYLNFGNLELQIALEWHDLSVSADLGKGLCKEILVAQSGMLSKGLCGILGESGSGKTTLLDTIAGRERIAASHVRGRLLVNGKERGIDWKRISSYVLQDDVFDVLQTVEDTVRFSANLRLPSLMNETERAQICDAVLKQVGLDRLPSGTLVRSLSGGERKRLAIAIELVKCPSIMFLDEPVSGLDAANALRILRLLKDLAVQNSKTIIVSIHQPDAYLYDLFDSVILLARGHLVYSGPGPAMREFFHTQGYPSHEGRNPADFAIHTVASLDEQEIARLSAACRHRDPGADFLSSLNADPTKEITSPNSNEQEMLLSSHEDEEEKERQSLALGGWAQPWLHQVVFLTLRSFRSLVRSRVLFSQNLIALATGLILGGLFFQLSNDNIGVQNRAGFLFFTSILLSVLALSSIDTFLRTRPLFLRERDAGFYTSSAFFFATAVADLLPLRVLPPLLLGALSYFLVGLQAGPSHFLWFLLLVSLTSFCATGICLMLSAAVNGVGMANLSATLVLLFSILFSGILLNETSLPPAISWLPWLSYIHHSFEALMINELGDLTIYITPPGQPIAYPTNGAYLLGVLGLVPSNFFLDVMLLLLMGLLFYAIAFILLLRLKEKR